MAEITLYGTLQCPFCIRAKALLNHKGLAFTEIRVDLDPGKRMEMMEKSGRRTVPQIFIDNTPIGGCDELFLLEARGELDALTNPSS